MVFPIFKGSFGLFQRFDLTLIQLVIWLDSAFSPTRLDCCLGSTWHFFPTGSIADLLRQKISIESKPWFLLITFSTFSVSHRKIKKKTYFFNSKQCEKCKKKNLKIVHLVSLYHFYFPGFFWKSLKILQLLSVSTNVKLSKINCFMFLLFSMFIFFNLKMVILIFLSFLGIVKPFHLTFIFIFSENNQVRAKNLKKTFKSCIHFTVPTIFYISYLFSQY